MKTIIRIFPVFLLFLFASPALAQSESLSEEDQIKAAIRLQFWQKTLFTRLLVRGDKALAYLDPGNDKTLWESIHAEAGFEPEEAQRWINMKNVELLETMGHITEPFYARIENMEGIDELETVLEEVDKAIFEEVDLVQAKILEEMGPERVAKLRKLGLQFSPHDPEPIDFVAYEYLDLTEDQKKQLEAIRNEYIQGHEAFLKEARDLQERAFALEIEWAKKGEEEIKANEAVIQKEVEKLEEQRKKIEGKFAGIVKSVKVKVNLLLTETQTKQLEKILDETPNWLKKLAGMATKPDHSWSDAWKPGDPVPEKESQKRTRKLFPMAE